MAKCKITVLRRMFNEDYARQYCVNPETGVCTVFQEGQVFVLDNQSRNGTYIKGERVKMAKLENGTKLRLGKYSLIFSIN